MKIILECRGFNFLMIHKLNDKLRITQSVTLRGKPEILVELLKLELVEKCTGYARWESKPKNKIW